MKPKGTAKAKRGEHREQNEVLTQNGQSVTGGFHAARVDGLWRLDRRRQNDPDTPPVASFRAALSASPVASGIHNSVPFGAVTNQQPMIE